MKKEILIIPFFGWAISRLKPISINRELKLESLRKVIEVGGERIRSGYWILVFPEGTRKKPEEGIGKFGNSCGVLASNESVPIIPICHNSGKFWINKSFNKKSGYICVVIGKPIFGDDPKKLTNTVPLYKDPSANLLLPSTQFDMYSAENSGLIEFDFLGLKTLTVINKTQKLINKETNLISIENINRLKFLFYWNYCWASKN